VGGVRDGEDWEVVAKGARDGEEWETGSGGSQGRGRWGGGSGGNRGWGGLGGRDECRFLTAAVLGQSGVHMVKQRLLPFFSVAWLPQPQRDGWL
jgi:hypothetical protein